MNTWDLTHVLINMAPLYTGITCCVIVGLGLFFRDGKKRSNSKAILLLLLLTIVINWACINMLHYVPGSISPMLPLMYLSVLFNPILFYRFIYVSTSTGLENRPFAKHYLLPLLAFVCIMSWTIGAYHHWHMDKITSEARRLEILELIGAASMIRWVFAFGYFIPGIIRVRRHYKLMAKGCYPCVWVRHFWLYTLILLFIAQIIFPFTAASLQMGERIDQYYGAFLTVISLLIVVQNVILTYRVMSRNDEALDEEPDYSPPSSSGRHYGQAADFRDSLEDYMAEQKPYLNPGLRITDMIRPLQTNRTYLSSFINETYGINFCSFVNSYRLAEYDALCNDERNHGITKNELVLRVGFSNYKAYQRARKSVAAESASFRRIAIVPTRPGN